MKTLQLPHLLTLALVAGAATVAHSAPLPANLAGKWAMTMISGTTYWDKGTGAYAGSGNGGALIEHETQALYGLETSLAVGLVDLAVFNPHDITRPLQARQPRGFVWPRDV